MEWIVPAGIAFLVWQVYKARRNYKRSSYGKSTDDFDKNEYSCNDHDIEIYTSCDNDYVEYDESTQYKDYSEEAISTTPHTKIKATTSDGKCTVYLPKNHLSVLQIDDADDYYHDHRRWARVHLNNEWYCYEWVGGHWTKNTFDLNDRDALELFICAEMDLLPKKITTKDIKTTKVKMFEGKQYFCCLVADHTIEANFNLRGHVVYFKCTSEHKEWSAKFNTKSGEITLPITYQEWEIPLKKWLNAGFTKLKAKAKA